MSELTFDVAWEQGNGGEPLEAATCCNLAIRAHGLPITEVRDAAARTTREVVRVSAYPLALWLASAWWRIRWEGRRGGIDWQLSHKMGAAGCGYAWPDATFESDGESIRVALRRSSGSAKWEPIAYLNDGGVTVSAGGFEAGVEEFVNRVIARLAETGNADSPLSRLWSSLRAERRDPRLAALRRLEATLGFDAEEAPANLLDAYAARAGEFGTEAVAELAALATNGSLPDWGGVSAALARAARIHIQDYARIRDAAREAARVAAPGVRPWERGEAAARAARGQLGVTSGVLSDDRLSEWLGADLKVGGSPGTVAALAKRTRQDVPDLRVCYRSAYHEGRRFELARLLGDHLVSAAEGDHLLPATRTQTARQRIQRAFAAELLIPWEDLAKRVGDAPDAEAIEDTAREYGVSPLVVRTRLVAKRVLAADALDSDPSW